MVILVVFMRFKVVENLEKPDPICAKRPHIPLLPEASGTAEFCILMDTFFDCLNVRNKEEYKFKRKPNLKPYSDVNNERFSWLKNDFLRYFQEWKNSI